MVLFVSVKMDMFKTHQAFNAYHVAQLIVSVQAALVIQVVFRAFLAILDIILWEPVAKHAAMLSMDVLLVVWMGRTVLIVIHP